MELGLNVSLTESPFAARIKTDLLNSNNSRWEISNAISRTKVFEQIASSGALDYSITLGGAVRLMRRGHCMA